MDKIERKILKEFRLEYDMYLTELIECCINYIDLEFANIKLELDRKSKLIKDTTKYKTVNQLTLNKSNILFKNIIKEMDKSISILLSELAERINSFTNTSANNFHNKVQTLVDNVSINTSQEFRKLVLLDVKSKEFNGFRILNNLIKELFEEVQFKSIEMLDNEIILYLSIAKNLTEKNRKAKIDTIINNFNTVRGLEDYLEIIFDLIKDSSEREEVEILNNSEEVLSKKKYQKESTLSYKELNKFAEENGYKINRYNGDHAIYTKENSNSIPIPQRKMNRYLAKAIYNSLKEC